MWEARNKTDLAIEVWEKLDCESVGASEIEAIETAIADVFGSSAVDSPMVLARLLADEGAELRHSEIMDLYVRRTSPRPSQNVGLATVLDASSLTAALESIRRMETLRRKFTEDGDRDSLRLLRQKAIAEKEKKLKSSKSESREIAEWLTLWLQSPELFETWITLRRQSAEFRNRYGEL